jgi:hypothetical protein
MIGLGNKIIIPTAKDLVDLHSYTQGTSNVGAYTIEVDYPIEKESGDVLVLAIRETGRTSALTSPSGWTKMQDNYSNSTVEMSLHYKIATGTESGTISIGKQSRYNAATGVVMLFKNCAVTNPVQESTVVSGVSMPSNYAYIYWEPISYTVNNSIQVRIFYTSENVYISSGLSNWSKPIHVDHYGSLVVLTQRADSGIANDRIYWRSNTAAYGLHGGFGIYTQ